MREKETRVETTRDKETGETIHTREYEATSRIICDICGKEAEGLGTYEDVNWESKSYLFEETSVKISHGSSYPEGGWKSEKIIDICPECFEGYLLDSDIGDKFHQEETDW